MAAGGGHACRHRKRESVRLVSHTMGLPVLLRPVAPAVLQNAPGVTHVGGADGAGAGAGTTVGMSIVGGAGISSVVGGGGWTVVVIDGGAGSGVVVVVVGATVTEGEVVAAVSGTLMMVAGTVLGTGACRRTGRVESCFGATTPINMNNGTDAASTQPAVLLLPMRAQRNRPRTRPIIPTTTVPNHMSMTMMASVCMVPLPPVFCGTDRGAPNGRGSWYRPALQSTIDQLTPEESKGITCADRTAPRTNPAGAQPRRGPM
ncbi:hypothetical protein OHB26_15780 [Nocardia sp. NBC_01503]|uniref:hypothetical protein n=1 Tax=Nocardia sp. NBC_01503 TaxID=2975997 RepID=UPI002E7B1ECF|nr:hypothetical protein [Nocardia sp. NBC_01503]WTL35522.1 hypothetical protein OHB26_15780 [Nocardia sp. NBC_01503]